MQAQPEAERLNYAKQLLKTLGQSVGLDVNVKETEPSPSALSRPKPGKSLPQTSVLRKPFTSPAPSFPHPTKQLSLAGSAGAAGNNILSYMWG